MSKRLKQAIEELALFGGAPAFTEKLHVGRPNIGNHDRLIERINTVLDTRWLSNMGPFEQEFERRIAEMLGVRHCIAICNATVALEIVIRALDLRGEVIVPSFTFVATAHALQWQQITPVFCDVDPATHNLDPIRVEEMITSKTTGIIGVHLWGRPCNVEALTNIAREHNLKLLFDAAHAFGCSHNGQMIGNFGDAEVFSFHATKFLNSFEGGAIVTNNDDLAAKIRLMKNFGFKDYDRVIYIGINGKMHEVSAAMGLTSLDSIDLFIDANRTNYITYKEELAGLSGVRLLNYDNQEQHNYQYVVLEIDESRTSISRDQMVNVLWAENIIARRYFFPGCDQMEPYRTLYPSAREMLPVTERLTERVLVLPSGTAIGPDEIREICAIVRLAVSSGSEVAAIIQDKTELVADH